MLASRDFISSIYARATTAEPHTAMGYPTKVQLIRRKKGADQYYINFPTAVAEALEFQKGETIEWIIENKANIIAHRPVVPPSPVTIEKKTACHS